MDKNELRRLAIAQTLFPPTSLRKAIQKLGFIQADPIRSPARAQDLILRHRVTNYKVNDLEKNYPNLDIEEDYLYAYGFMPRSISNIWHPKKLGKLTTFDKKVLEAARSMEEVTPKILEAHLGKKTARNWWGGKSRAAQLSLDTLSYWGLVRVSRREKGQRVYVARKLEDPTLSPMDRKKQLILTVVNILGPITERKLNETTRHIKRTIGNTKSALFELKKSGQLVEEQIDGIKYILSSLEGKQQSPIEGVKILAPFDPIIWDRNRFEHLWGWEYRFEAYTPASKRIRGYYAMPILWNENIIGWANLKKEGHNLSVDLGFVNKKPKDKIFETQLEKEIDNIEKFLDFKMIKVFIVHGFKSSPNGGWQIWLMSEGVHSPLRLKN